MSGGMFWAEMAQLMHNATADYAKLGIGLYNDKFTRQQQRKALEHQIAYDKNRISWAVADAKRAGLHPLAALGIPAGSSSVMSVGAPSSPRPDGMLNHDFSKFSKLADEAAKLANEQTRLQNDKLRAQIENERAKTAKAERDSAASPVRKQSNGGIRISGFDKDFSNTFSISESPDGTLNIAPSKDIQVDDLSSYFAQPQFFGGKWNPTNSGINVILAYLNSPNSSFGKQLKPNERWIADWSFGRGNYFRKHTASNFDLYKFKRSRLVNDPKYIRGKGRVKVNPVDRYNLHLKSKYKDYQ